MAEEKKKRWRPSLTAYREMEETVHRQCVELDAWRVKYHALSESYERADSECVKLSDILRRQKKQMEACEVVTVGEYNTLMAELKRSETVTKRLEDESSVLKAKTELFDSIISEKERRIAELEGRGFWKRLFNKK